MSGVIAGLVLSTAGVGLSVNQYAQQKKAFNEAERETEAAMKKAREVLNVNYLAGLTLNTEPFERAREAVNIGLAQQTQAGLEGETRGAGATAGRAQMASIEAQRGLATAQADRLLELEKLAKSEDARLQGLEYQLELGGVTGAQQAQADAIAAQQRAIGQAAAQLGQAGGILLKSEETNPLYSKEKGKYVLPNSKAVVDKQMLQSQIISPTTRESFFKDRQINPQFGIEDLQQLYNPLYNPKMDLFSNPFNSVGGGVVTG